MSRHTLNLPVRLRLLRQGRKAAHCAVSNFEQAMQQAKQRFALDMLRLEQSLAQNRQLLAALEARNTQRMPSQ